MTKPQASVDRGETLSEELIRLVGEYRSGGENRNEAWNLLADFTECNCDAIVQALNCGQTPVGERDGDWQLVPKDDVTRDHANSALPTAMVFAGADALDKIESDLLEYKPGETADWDNYMAAVAVFRAMSAAAPPPPPETTVDTTKLNAGQLVQRIMRAMDGDLSAFPNGASLAEHIAAEILKLPKDYWRKPPPETRAAGVGEEVGLLFVREALLQFGVHEEFDYPGDVPESCGMYCDMCKQHVSDDRKTGHKDSCPSTVILGIPHNPAATKDN